MTKDTSTPKGHAPREDPRLAQTRELVLDAAVKLLIAEGISSVTAGKVHKTTGVSRTTIYRHWPTRTDLLLATVDRITVSSHPIDATDDFESDVHYLLTKLTERMEKRPVREFVSAAFAMAVDNHDHAPVVRRFFDGMLSPIHQRISVEGERLDIDADEIDMLHDRIVSPFVFRYVLMFDSIKDEQVDRVLTELVQFFDSAGS